MKSILNPSELLITKNIEECFFATDDAPVL